VRRAEPACERSSRPGRGSPAIALAPAFGGIAALAPALARGQTWWAGPGPAVAGQAAGPGKPGARRRGARAVAGRGAAPMQYRRRSRAGESAATEKRPAPRRPRRAGRTGRNQWAGSRARPRGRSVPGSGRGAGVMASASAARTRIHPARGWARVLRGRGRPAGTIRRGAQRRARNCRQGLALGQQARGWARRAGGRGRKAGRRHLAGAGPGSSGLEARTRRA